ncbi:MAG TPA: OmpA family protein [Pyrinomonadaceae bacterium]|nr:OmpA family protein [Pyrinomonadaceae bacterium]
MIQDEELLTFNFWPSFADMMLALVLVLCLVLFLISATIAVGTVNLREVETNQMSLVKAIALDYKVVPRKLSDTTYGISFRGQTEPDIEIHNDLNLQRITFSDRVLFEPDHTEIKPEGEEVLRIVGRKLREQLQLIREIQIQGHADTVPSKRYASNVELAANRAIAVFEFLRNKVGIQPAEHLMSVTSFGEYKSVQRNEDKSYSQDKLLADNLNDELKRRNRRIELVLIYRR